MTLLEKKQTIKKVVDTLAEGQLDEALLFIQNLSETDLKRKDFTNHLLKNEESLFKRLAE